MRPIQIVVSADHMAIEVSVEISHRLPHVVRLARACAMATPLFARPRIFLALVGPQMRVNVANRVSPSAAYAERARLIVQVLPRF